MALDEALLLGRLRYGSPPTLRFFAWSPPTISLGYGQRLDGRIDERAAEDLGLGLVRRAPVDMVPVQPSDLAAMPAFCFARTGSFELEVDGKKLVGSAQRRQGAAFLQHGAIMLGAEPGRLRRVFPTERDPLAGMTTLEAVLGRRPSFDAVAEA